MYGLAYVAELLKTPGPPANYTWLIAMKDAFQVYLRGIFGNYVLFSRLILHSQHIWSLFCRSFTLYLCSLNFCPLEQCLLKMLMII